MRSMSRVKEIELARMAPLREVSQKIAKFLQQTLSSYIQPMSPLMAAHRVLGESLEGFQRERVPGADKAYASLENQFVQLCRNTFKFPHKLRKPLPAIKTNLEVYPWEYLYEVGGDPNNTITISSPVRWVLAYDNPYTLSSLIKAKLAGEKPQMEATKQLIINSVTMALTMERAEGIKQILADLRFPVSVATSPVSGNLPYVVVDAPVESYRPQDDLITTVIQLSGRPVFEELVDLDEIDTISDPLADKIKDLAI